MKALQGVAILARAKEPSSWAGAAVILQGAGVFFPQYAVILTAIAGLLGAVAVKLPENGKPALPAVPDSGPLAFVASPSGPGPGGEGP